MLIEGEVVARPENGRNAELATGEVEVKAVSMRIVGPAETPAIPVVLGKGETLPSEELRLRHRYLDLRRPELQANIVLRHRLMQATREHLSERGFLEIETPILTKPTPEGARDYLVPSRVSAGEFYALPQSPQLYKQLLMISGFDRYFQIARCFRDEDLRADRQPEFTQIDIEASFISAEDIYALAEGLIAALWKEAGVSITTPFPRMTYADAVERYGTDRPDLRYGLELFDATEAFRAHRLRDHARRDRSGRARARDSNSRRRGVVAQAGGRARGVGEERGRRGHASPQAREGRAHGTAGEVSVAGAGRTARHCRGRAVSARGRAGSRFVARARSRAPGGGEAAAARSRRAR